MRASPRPAPRPLTCAAPQVHNGKEFTEVLISEQMVPPFPLRMRARHVSLTRARVQVGMKFGQFAITRKMPNHPYTLIKGLTVTNKAK